MIGFSFSPGGLLLPYHLGVLTSLTEHKILTDKTPIVGASAGAIAVASHACQISPLDCVDASIRLSSKLEQSGGFRGGKLLSLLEEELDDMLPSNAHEIVNARQGLTGLAYKQIFPTQKNVLKTKFDSRDELIEDVCNSSVFPFFTTNWPFVVRYGSNRNNNASNDSDEGMSNPVTSYFNFNLPRLIVDGYFTVPRERFGCPFIPESNIRTVTISCFPHDTIGLVASKEQDRISPLPCSISPTNQLSKLITAATTPSTKEEFQTMFSSGKEDGLRWIEQYGDTIHDNDDAVNDGDAVKNQVEDLASSYVFDN